MSKVTDNKTSKILMLQSYILKEISAQNYTFI